jgi:hypothetical protein
MDIHGTPMFPPLSKKRWYLSLKPPTTGNFGENEK